MLTTGNCRVISSPHTQRVLPLQRPPSPPVPDGCGALLSGAEGPGTLRYLDFFYHFPARLRPFCPRPRPNVLEGSPPRECRRTPSAPGPSRGRHAAGQVRGAPRVRDHHPGDRAGGLRPPSPPARSPAPGQAPGAREEGPRGGGPLSRPRRDSHEPVGGPARPRQGGSGCLSPLPLARRRRPSLPDPNRVGGDVLRWSVLAGGGGTGTRRCFPCPPAARPARPSRAR
jgi:hypothetical protein